MLLPKHGKNQTRKGDRYLQIGLDVKLLMKVRQLFTQLMLLLLFGMKECQLAPCHETFTSLHIFCVYYSNEKLRSSTAMI